MSWNFIYIRLSGYPLPSVEIGARKYFVTNWYGPETMYIALATVLNDEELYLCGQALEVAEGSELE